MPSRFLLTALISFLVAAPAFPDDLNLLWERATVASSAGAPEKSIPAWNEWIQTASIQGIHSAEAHYNLAGQYWQNQKGAETVQNLIEAARLRTSLLRAWQDLNQLSDVQVALGSKEPLSDSLFWRLDQFALYRSLILLGCALAWLFISGIFFRFGMVPARSARGLITFGILSVVSVGAYLGISHLLAPRLSILSDASGKISVYREAKDTEDQKLIELAPGTLVSCLQEKEGFIRIQDPVAGWIAKPQVVILSN